MFVQRLVDAMEKKGKTESTHQLLLLYKVSVKTVENIV